jgi:hypothetical protein
MKTILTVSVATLLSVSITSIAATVEYQHPDLTIVAKEEPLDVVLKSLGKAMRIYITVPSGLNPLVNCDIQQQPAKQAFKTLLGDMSYSLEWEEKTGKLVGLTILAGGEDATIATASAKPVTTQNVSQTMPIPVASTSGQDAANVAAQISHDSPIADDEAVMADHDAAMAEHEARMETERAEHEARMETQRVEHEARMVEERAEQQVRIKEEVERHDANMAAYLESQGLQLPQ